MNLDEYILSLPAKGKLSDVKLKILTRLWGKEIDPFPKPWVSSEELLELTKQKYFDRRTRELRDSLGCRIETAYQEKFSGHGWRFLSPELLPGMEREYLSQTQKEKLFSSYDYCCSTCGVKLNSGVKGLQADHKIPLSRGGGNEANNWQPMCNNCNVGKRRVCEGCKLDCKTCSWAFPEIVGVKTMLSLSEKTLRKVNLYVVESGMPLNLVMEEAVEYYIRKKQE